jgi:hypothetical protein
MQVPQVFDLPRAEFSLMHVGSKFPPSIPSSGWQLPGNGHSYSEARSHNGNVGFILGRGYIGFDLDDPSAFEGLSLPPTTTWLTRPGRYGKLFKGEVLPAVMAKHGKPANHAQFYLFKGGLQVGEIKLQRAYQVIPESWKILADGKKCYYFMVDSIPPSPIDLGTLLSDILALPGLSLVQNPKGKSASCKPVKPYVPSDAPNSPVETPVTNNLSYACAALLSELAATERAPASTRFNQVYRSGCALGEFVGAGLLPEGATFNALVEAGETSGLSRYESIKSARNGIAKGKQNPRRISEA